MIQLSTNIQGEPVDLSHEEPSGTIVVPDLVPGETRTIQVQPMYENTGNVPQTVTVPVATSDDVTVGAVVIRAGGSNFTDEVTLSPGQVGQLQIEVIVPMVEPGSTVPATISVSDVVWS